MSFAKIISDARKKLGWYQRDVAERIKTTQSYVTRLEQGVVFPSLETTRALADAFGLPIKDLWEQVLIEKELNAKAKLEKTYFSRFGMNYKGQPVSSSVLHDLERALIHPQDIFELENAAFKVVNITQKFWYDWEAMEESEDWKNLVLERMEAGAEYIYLYPADVDEADRRAKILKKERYSKFENVKMFAVPGLKDLFLFLGCQDITLYNSRDYSDRYDLGFYVDFFNNAETKGTYDAIVHMRLLEKTLQDISFWVAEQTRLLTPLKT